MGKTRRNKKRRYEWGPEETNEAVSVDHALTYWKARPYKDVWVRRTDEEMERAEAEADAQYEEDIRRFALDNRISEAMARKHTTFPSWSFHAQPTITRRFVGVSYRKRVPITREEAITDAKENYAKRFRDGYLSDGGNKAYKRLSKKTVRRASKEMIRAYMKYGEYDKPTPGDHLGKVHIWSVW